MYQGHITTDTQEKVNLRMGILAHCVGLWLTLLMAKAIYEVNLGDFDPTKILPPDVMWMAGLTFAAVVSLAVLLVLWR